MHDFQASVQYDDWAGTVAGDEQEHIKFLDAVRKAANLGNDDFLVGVEFYNGESDSPYFTAVVVEGANNYEDAMKKLDVRLLHLKRVSFDLSLTEFFKCFKRFSLKMSKKGMGLADRSYDADEAS